MINKIKQLAEKNAEWVKDIRHHLHANPELSFEEFETSKYIYSKLIEMGLDVETGYVKTGMVATLKCKNSDKKTIALRADMDALSIVETNDVAYKSKNSGVMHACGHDVHSASVLGTAKILSELKDDIEGTYKFIFQPGEEKLPGGASLMIQEGLFKKHPINAMLGQHVTPQIESGQVGFRAGMFMASTDEIYIEVIGKGGHAAMPHLYNNPIFIASELLLKLNEVFMSDALKNNGIETPTVLAFGKIIGNGATNVIPEKVNIEGTFRTFNEEWRMSAHEKIKAICAEIATKSNAQINCNIMYGYPFLVNDEIITNTSKKAAQEFLGVENVIDLDYRMTAEDFAFFSQQVRSCFYRIGTGNVAKNITSNVHTSTFDIDENSLEIMVGLMSYIATKQ